MRLAFILFCFMILLFVGVHSQVEYLFQASAISERLDITEPATIDELRDVLHHGWEVRMVFNGLPWLIIIIMLGFCEFSAKERRGRE